MFAALVLIVVNLFTPIDMNVPKPEVLTDDYAWHRACDQHDYVLERLLSRMDGRQAYGDHREMNTDESTSVAYDMAYWRMPIGEKSHLTRAEQAVLSIGYQGYWK